jgi:hypothetical protein
VLVLLHPLAGPGLLVLQRKALGARLGHQVVNVLLADGIERLVKSCPSSETLCHTIIEAGPRPWVRVPSGVLPAIAVQGPAPCDDRTLT